MIPYAWIYSFNHEQRWPNEDRDIYQRIVGRRGSNVEVVPTNLETSKRLGSFLRLLGSFVEFHVRLEIEASLI